MINIKNFIWPLMAIIALLALGSSIYFKTMEVSAETMSASIVDYIYVDVKGEVENPGVYRVTSETRLFQIVQIAGGLTSYANTSTINLAVKLKDEQMVIVPSGDEEEESTLININSATVEQLITLPGIGTKTANDIIAFRQENGYFTKVEDILNVSGIGEATLSKIIHLITV